MAENINLLNLDPEDINARVMMGDSFSKNNEQARAFDEYLKAVEDLSNRGQADKIPPIHKKMALLDPGQLRPDARKKYDLVRLSLKADEALAGHRTEEAVEALAEISKSEPDDILVLTKLAELEEKLGRIPDAAGHYFRLGELFLKSRLLKKALEIFKKATALDPQNIPARSTMAQIFLKQGSENEAKKEYLNIAEQALAAGNLDAALEYGKLAVELKSIEAHYFVGIVLFERRNWDGAKAAFEHLLRFKPNHVAALVYLGKVYDGMDQPSKAAEAFQKALKIEKDHLPALEAWADYCVRKKDKKEAIQTLTLLVNKAEEGKDPARAAQWARTLVSMDGNLPPSQLKLAEALEKNGDRAGAADVYYHLALMHGQPNQAEAASRYIRKALELNPTHPKASAAARAEAQSPAPPAGSLGPEREKDEEAPAPAVEVSRAEAFQAQMDVAEQYVKEGFLDEAIDIYQQLIEANPDRPEVKAKLNGVYAAYAQTGTDLAKAIDRESELQDEAAAADTKETAPPARGKAETPAAEETRKETEEERKIQEEAEMRIRAEAEKKIHEEAEKRIREEEERKVREELEKKIRQEIEQKVRAEIEKEEREEAEKKIREEAEKKAGEEAARQIREAAEREAREAAERRIREELERKAREEAQKKTLDEIQRKIRESVEKKAREEALRKAEEAEREKAETERKIREEVERKVREEMERKTREEAEKKIRESVERQVREEAEKNVLAEVERRTREELERQFRDGDQKGARRETDGEAAAIVTADKLYSEGHYEQALGLYEKILESHPGHPRALVKLSVVKEVLKSKEALAAHHGPPVLKLVESPAKPGPEKDDELKKKGNKIGYV